MTEAKSRIIFSVLISLLVMFSGVTQANERYGKQKVVYHISFDDPAKLAGAMRNMENQIRAVGEKNIDLKVIVLGKGLSLFLKPRAAGHTKLQYGNATKKMLETINGLKKKGVNFQVCSNTLRGKKIDYQKDLSGIRKQDIVPSGVAELSRLQAMGYTYIRP